MAPTALPSAEYLRQCFDYDPNTGALTWRKTRPLEHFKTEAGQRRWLTQVAGKPAGSLTPPLAVSINRITYRLHRVIWKMMTGNDPVAVIDHRNRDPSDNRWDNLREATRQQNTWNSHRRKRDGSLPCGVFVFHKNGVQSGRYHAHVCQNRRQIYLGTFDTPQEAEEAYISYVKEHRGNFHPHD